jgi:hypothetical protein
MPESTHPDGAEGEAPKPEVAAVSRTVLAAYFDELAKADGFAEITPKLRALVLDQGVLAEPAIRAAMFSDVP